MSRNRLHDFNKLHLNRKLSLGISICYVDNTRNSCFRDIGNSHCAKQFNYEVLICEFLNKPHAENNIGRILFDGNVLQDNAYFSGKGSSAMSNPAESRILFAF